MTEEKKQAEEHADKQRVERVREFDHNKLPRDKDGKVIIPEDMTYAEFLKLTHPEMDENDIARAIKKENRGAWMVRLEALGFIILIVVIIVLMVTR